VPTLDPRFLAAVASGKVSATTSQLAELERADPRLQLGVLALTAGLLPTGYLFITSVFRDAPQHKEGRAVDVALRFTNALVPAQRGRDPHYNENVRFILGSLFIWRHAINEGLGAGVPLPALVIEADHLHVMTGDGLDEQVWVYHGQTTYTTDLDLTHLFGLLGQTDMVHKLRPATDFT